ncbi:carboxylesterase 1D [Leptinotarsa decemlineata]|uniref:carboxylesterase 1D n=1 Tax=Leptinotarsa decemlineata TaxID=7539 RepID=UPI003D306EFA
MLMMFYTYIFIFAGFLWDYSKGDLIVNTKYGLMLGKEAETIDFRKPYYSFLGIPYAKPPIGKLRFKAPEPFDSWLGIFSATSEGNICIQENTGSEDCLYINVYTPKRNDTSSKLSVMVWIYGGGFLTGSSNYKSFSPDYFLNEDVIFVSLNYRLGIFGFFSTGDEAAYGNWGLKDQILGLKWIQENIENFGGDKNNVTVFGHSAGSASISYLLQSPLAANLFQRAIMQSGTSLNLWGFTRKPRDVAFTLGSYLQIYTNDSEILTEKLREQDADTLSMATIAISFMGPLLTNPFGGLMFAPCEEPNHEGALFNGKSHENLRTGNFNRVPVIIGFTSQEGLPFYNIFDRIRLYLLIYDFMPNRMVPIDLNIIDTARFINITRDLKTKYFPNTQVVFNNYSLVQFITDDQFVRPINEAARLMSKWVPTYLYRFSYMNKSKFTNDSDLLGRGVPHGGELEYLNPLSDNPNQSGLDLLTRQRLVKLWTNFAKTSNPTPCSEPLFEDLIWKPYSEDDQFLDIGRSFNLSSNMEYYSQSWWKVLFNKYGNPPFDTY